MAAISAIKLPNGTIYTLKDNGALQLTGGQVTGPVSFGDSVSIDEATLGDLIVNGSASFTNGAHGVIDKAKAADVTSTLNALVKYEDTEGTFSDSNIYNTSNNLVIGSTSVPGNIQIGAKNDNYGILPNTSNYNQIGSTSLYWYRAYVTNYYGGSSHVTNWDAGKNIGTPSTSSAAATLGSVYFYNACAAGSTQTKTLLSNGSATSNITITLPSTAGTLALTSQIPDISGKADKATTLAGYGITDAKIASGVITLGSNTITPLTSSSTLNAAKLSGAIPSAVTATTQASTDNSTKIATTAYVTTAIANLPEPMVFKGSVGTGGTITSLPTAAASNEGHTYKVITALSSPSAKVGDTVISNGSSWIVIPSGDEPSGTVTSVGASNATDGGLTISGSPITSSGTITIGHSNVLSSAQTTQAVYPIKIDKNGHISAYGSAVTIPTVPSNIVNTITTTAGAHTAISSKSGAVSFNVPTKTSHLTNDSGFLTSVANDSHNHSPDTIYIPTNYARTGSLDLFSATKIGSYMSNKSFAIPPEAITIEYSTDGGSTWKNYGATDLHKRGLFAETRSGCDTYLGKATTKAANSLNNQLRITISRINLGRYTAINSFYTWMTTNGNTVYCKLERSLNSSPTEFETVFTDFKLAGWSGHNIRYFPTMALGGGNDNQPYAIRLTVWQTAITTSYPSANLYDIRFYGPDTYSASAPYYKVQTNELYTWDNSLNAIFPAGITATSFSGNLTGNASGTASNVTGTVAIANGGTGQTTAANAINALLNGLPTWTADPTDTTYFVRQDTGGAAAYGKVQATTLWNYISGKLPAWSKASTKPSYTASEVGALASNTTYVSTITTTAGTHSAISSKSGAVSFNVPTKTSHLTNDSGFLTSSSTLDATKLSGTIPASCYTNTDTKVTQTEISTSSRPNAPLHLLFASTDITGTVTSGVSYINWLSYNPSENELNLAGSGTIGATNLYGSVLGGDSLHLSSGSPSWYDNTLTATGTTANRSYNLPNKSGTVALTSDIPTVPTKVSQLTNDSGFLTSSSTLDATKLSGTIPTGCYTNTKNTAGSTDSSSKLFLIGATSQAANPQTYSHDNVYINNSGYLYSYGKPVMIVDTLSSAGLTPYSNRCTIQAGGIYQIGAMVFVQIKLKNSGSLGSNNTWGYLNGFPVPSTTLAAMSVYAVQNYGNISGQINEDGRLVLATGGSALAANTIISVTGWYMTTV